MDDDDDDVDDDDSIQWEMSIMCKAERLMLVSFIYSENCFGLNGTYCAAQIGRALVWTKKVHFLCMNAPPNSKWQLPFCLCVGVCGRPWHSLAFLPFGGGCRSPTWQRSRRAGGGVRMGMKPLAGAQLGVRRDLQGEASLWHPGAAPRESLHLHRGMSADWQRLIMKGIMRQLNRCCTAVALDWICIRTQIIQEPRFNVVWLDTAFDVNNKKRPGKHFSSILDTDKLISFAIARLHKYAYLHFIFFILFTVVVYFTVCHFSKTNLQFLI